MSEFFSVINHENVKVAVHCDDHFTFGTSPYYAHQNGLAIDIYRSLSLNNYEALSPVSGKITKIRVLKAPNPKFLDGINRDYLTLIENPSHPESVFKIMHINPSLNEGDWIEIGENLGTTIKNGYFAPWSSPHIHLEIRPKEDAIRARGGKNFPLVFDPMFSKKTPIKTKNQYKIPINIEELTPEFVLCRVKLEGFYHKLAPFCGIKVQIDNINCIFDGGIPHYKGGLVIFHKDCSLSKKGIMKLNDITAGFITHIRDNFAFINFYLLKIYFNEEHVRGVSFFLANNRPLIKIILLNGESLSSISKSSNYITINKTSMI